MDMNTFTGKSPAKASSKESEQPWTPQKLRSLGCYWSSRIISTAVHLELFDWLGTRDRAAFHASRHFGGTSHDWEIYLDALSAMKLLRKAGSRYRNSRFARRYLCSKRGDVLLPDHDAWQDWGRLPDILTDAARPKIARPFLTDRFKAQRLLHALDLDGGRLAPHLLRRWPLRDCKCLLDVGGGLGTFAIACCRRYPKLRATIVEHPNVAALTVQAVKKSRLGHRIDVIALDFVKERWPDGFDVVLLSNVLHGQGARQSHGLIASAYRSLGRGGRLIVRDVLLGADRTASAWGAVFSVALMVQTPGGQCHSLREVRQWLRDAGFRDLQGPWSSSPAFFDPDSVLIARKR